jgi:hypothetical protein
MRSGCSLAFARGPFGVMPQRMPTKHAVTAAAVDEADGYLHRTRSGGARRVQSLLLPEPATDMVRHWVSQFFCWLAYLGLSPRNWVALQVRDRVSGHVRADAVVLPTVAGSQYIVSMFGTVSDWVQNLDAAHGDAVISHGASVRVRLVPVPPEERAPVLQEYVRVASTGRKHFPLRVAAPLADFAAIRQPWRCDDRWCGRTVIARASRGTPEVW